MMQTELSAFEPIAECQACDVIFASQLEIIQHVANDCDAESFAPIAEYNPPNCIAIED